MITAGLSPGAPQQGLSALASREEGPRLGGHSDVVCDCCQEAHARATPCPCPLWHSEMLEFPRLALSGQQLCGEPWRML